MDTKKYRYVDFHCHLDLYPNFEEMINLCELHQIYTLTVTTTPKAWPTNYALTSRCKYVRPGLGIHPQLVSERASELELWKEYLQQARYVGEVGLDAGPKYYRSFDLQLEVFSDVLKSCDKIGEKILSVHSVRSTKHVLDLIEKHLCSRTCVVVLHWFTGSKSEAKRAHDLGCYFSINSEMLRRDRSRQLVASLALERLITETDGPFVKVGNRPAAPKDVASTLESMSQLFNKPADIIANQIFLNFEKVVSLGATCR